MPTRFMVVDDEPDLRELLCDELQILGFEVITAVSGNDALKKLERTTVAGVICDVRMPDGDGTYFLRELRKRHPTNPPVLLLSGFSDVTEDSAVALGAIALLGKPYDRNELIRRVKSMARDSALRT